MPNNSSHFSRKHEVEFGLVVTEIGTVRNEVKSVSCKSVESMGSFADWAYDKRIQIHQIYLGFVPQHRTQSDEKWWLTTIAVKVITAPINAMVTKSQGRNFFFFFSISSSQIMKNVDQLVVDLQNLSGMLKSDLFSFFTFKSSV